MELEKRRIYVGGMLYGWEEDFNQLLIKILEHHKIKISYYGNKKNSIYKTDGRRLRGCSVEYVIDNSLNYDPNVYDIKILHTRDIRDVVCEIIKKDDSYFNRDYRRIATEILNFNNARSNFIPDFEIKYEQDISIEMMDKLITLLRIPKKQLDFNFIKNAIMEFNGIKRNSGIYLTTIPLEGIRNIQEKHGKWLSDRGYRIV